MFSLACVAEVFSMTSLEDNKNQEAESFVYMFSLHWQYLDLEFLFSGLSQIYGQVSGNQDCYNMLGLEKSYAKLVSPIRGHGTFIASPPKLKNRKIKKTYV